MERIEIAQTSLANAKSMVEMYERSKKKRIFNRNLKFWKRRVKYWDKEITKLENAKNPK